MSPFIPEILATRMANGVLTETYPAGTMVVAAPRRAARGRSGETLFAALDLQASMPVPASEAEHLAELLTKTYFETPGSVTAALRAAVNAVNAEVTPFNSISSSAGGSAAGVTRLHAVCAVLREGDLLLGYAGDVLAQVLREDAVDQYPAPGDSPSRALGTTLNPELRYGHVALAGATSLILAPMPAAAWTAPASTGLVRLPLQSLGDRMARQTQSESHVVLLVRFTQAAETSKAVPLMERIRTVRPAGAEPPAGVQWFSAGNAPPRPNPVPPAPVDRAVPEPLSGRTGAVVPDSHAAIGNAKRTAPVAIPPEKTIPTEPRLTVLQVLRAFLRSVRISLDALLETARRFLAGLLPRGVMQQNDSFSLSPPAMLITAIAIPLVVVAVVAVLYFRKGREMEFQRLLDSASQQSAAAAAMTDPLSARSAWQTAFEIIEQAGGYGASPELTRLQNQAVHALDTLDGVVPLNFKPAVSGGFGPGTRITSLLAGDRELYALDSGHDRILRLLLGQGGYQSDDSFQCSAGKFPEITVGTPLDFAWVPDISVGDQQPSSSRGGAIVALDSQGVLLYCPPGGAAMAGSLPAPRNGWVSPAALDYYNGRLYVLDPGANGFWRFSIGDNGSFDKAPTDYFASDHPSLVDVVDFAVASGEVFFLHADGHVTRCQYDPLFAGTEGEQNGGTLCNDLTFNDTRPGRSAGSRIADAMLSRIAYNDPPEPTLFFLDPIGRGAYRFSLALNFFARYRVTAAPEHQEATALAIGSDKVLYIAIGAQIYYASTQAP